MMCELKYQDAVEEGRTEGVLDAIRNLMETLGLTIEQAMNALKIPEDDRPRYLKMLAEQ